ncbi:KAP family P-loop NTPase fold protein [Candidatus Palauibacter sp.]|uniref:KAP family P-loop NTPase fold protein n=1 Tax=Candidatus Palauibacter sp. TaxID=3101350 RepID=UPI003AF2D641
MIAAHLLASSSEEPLVLALHAPWGAGKSSFLNLLHESLETTDSSAGDPSPTLIRFNPWHYHTIDQLVHLFFDQLARGIDQDERIADRQSIGHLLTATADVLTAVPALTGPLLLLQPFLTKALRGFGDELKKPKSIHELKNDLDMALQALGRRVIVFVDDIDRLEPDAIRLLFRVIRLNANFPNVTYVLAFDRGVVENALDGVGSGRGRHYLEKIVQISFDIPEPERETIQSILDDRLDAVVSSIDARNFDGQRYRSLSRNGFTAHFRTVRAIKRYTNGLRLTLQPVAEEVDPVDFLGIERIRLFHPELHEEMAKAKDLLTSDGWLSELLM